MPAALAQLLVYPVKSCRGLALDSAAVERRGLAHDRRWMIVDEQHRFLTGRQLPQLVTLRAEPRDDGLLLHAPGREPLAVRAPNGEDTRARVTVWDDGVDALGAGAAADAWLSDWLGRRVHLVHMDGAGQRAVDPDYARTGDETSFADGFPLLLISQAALDALNARLAAPIPMTRFRPNLVVDGVTAHAEDGWRRIRVGTIEFEVVKPCTRCVFTTVDGERGVFDPSGEPLRTLKGYRRTPRGVTFGQNLIPRGSGMLHRGDRIELLEQRL
jgi:hypothetical protein